MTEQPLLPKASLLSPPKPDINEAIITSVVLKASEVLKIDDWRKIGQKMLKQALPINPLVTHPGEGDLGGGDIGLWLEAVERDRRSAWGNLCYPKETVTSNNRSYTQEQFFEQVLQQGKSHSCDRVAIMGASGTGKTTILHKIAFWVLEKTEDVPIWISASDLGKLSLRQYLEEKWLPRAIKPQILTTNEIKNRFESLLNSGHLWLLLDGIDELSFEHLSPVSPFSSNSQEAQILSPLTVLTQQLQGWTDRARVILTSRSYAWETDRTTLGEFDIYSPLGLNDTEIVRPFVRKWFSPSVANHYSPIPYWQAERSETTNNSQNLAQSLCNAIEQFGQERIEELVNTPLRLSLLCRLWQQRHLQLPATKAKLYQQLVAEVYQWQAEKGDFSYPIDLLLTIPSSSNDGSELFYYG